ncbi:MAG: hypothetical protein JNK35_11685 [Phycisphaerae bacterium]|nr:hypothetical protein [Phycisphaerae bacterium]
MTTLAAPSTTIEPKPIGGLAGSPAPSAADTMPWRATLAAGDCFFAIITPDALSPSGAALSRRLLQSLVASRSPALDEALQRWLPVPVEQVHAAYVLVGHTTAPLVAACAVPLHTMEEWRDAGILSAGPQNLPACVIEAIVSAGLPSHTLAATDFEFMTGPFAPRAITIAARRTRAVTLVGVLATAGLVALGLSRRAAHHDDLAASLAASTQQVHQRALGGMAHADPERHRLAMAAEITRLRTAAAGVREVNPPIDAAAITSDILSRWPRESPNLFARLQSVSITPVGITLGVLLAADADPEPILAGLRSLPGWQLQPATRSGAPSAPNGQAEARLTLRLIRTPTSPP